jgi:hypothetical protein
MNFKDSISKEDILNTKVITNNISKKKLEKIFKTFET